PRPWASRVAYAFLVYVLPPVPRCSDWASSSLISPSRISLPRNCSRVGLHIVLFEDCSAFTRVAARTLAPSPIRDLLHRRLQPFRYLHDCSGCFRLERLAGRGLHPLESAALSRRTREEDIADRTDRDMVCPAPCGKTEPSWASASVESARIMHDSLSVIMPFVTIRHVTIYRYRRPVAFGEHRMMLRPRGSRDQRVIQADLRISPEPTKLRFVQDTFGNNVGIARFSRRSKELSFESVVCVEHSPCDSVVLEDGGRPFSSDYSVNELRGLAPYVERHQLDPIDEVGRWARQLLLPSGAIGAFELLTRLSQAIHHDFLYRRREAKGIQPPIETLRLGHGSCRDFAMLMIDAARSFGLAARFSSGYLALSVSDRQAQTSGSARGSTHAWAQIYLPGAGWVD